MILKFRDINFHVSTKIRDNMNNVVIGNFKDIKYLLNSHINYDKVDLSRKAGTLSLFRNLKNEQKGVLLITGGSQKDIQKAIFKLFDQELAIYDEQQLSVKSDSPTVEKAKPFSTKSFIPLNKKIYFKDLGFKPVTLVGSGVFKVSYNFRLYPTAHFRKGVDFIRARLKYFSSDVSKMSKTFNFSINGVFVHQHVESNLLNSIDNTYRDTGEFLLSPLLLNGGGDVSFDIEISTTLKDPLAQPSDVRLTLQDSSYFILPEGESF